MLSMQKLRTAGAGLLAGSFFFVYAFDVAYFSIGACLLMFLVGSFFESKRRARSKIVRLFQGTALLLLVVGMFVILNTVFLLRVDKKICTECLVITPPSLFMFYLYCAAYCVFVGALVGRFFTREKPFPEEEDRSSAISYKQLITASRNY